MLLKFHHPPSPHTAASAWTVGDAVEVLRTVNQCWSRLHRKASSLVGLTSASECVVPVTGTQFTFHTSRALVSTWMLKLPSTAALPESSAMYRRKSAESTPASFMRSRSRWSNSAAMSLRSLAVK